jgi:hypothetical protein
VKRALLKIALSSFGGFICGFVLVWPQAHQWSMVLPNQRLYEAAIFFAASMVLSLMLAKRQRGINPQCDVARAMCLTLGAAVCFSLTRQEVVLFVHASLWATPGTFLGSALAKVLFFRHENSPRVAMKEKAERLLSS